MPPDNSLSGAFHGIQSGMEWTSGAIVGKLMATPVWELSWIDGAAAGSLTELCPKVSVSFSCRIESLIRQTKPREGGRRSGLQPTEPPSPKPAHAPFLLGSVLYARSARQTLQVPMELNSDLLDLAIAKKSRNVPSLSGSYLPATAVASGWLACSTSTHHTWVLPPQHCPLC